MKIVWFKDWDLMDYITYTTVSIVVILLLVVIILFAIVILNECGVITI